MQITNKVFIEKSGSDFVRLTEKHLVFNEEKNTEKMVDKNVREFGTVYQALQHIVMAEYDLEKPMQEQLIGLLESIEKAKEVIKQEFRTDVRTTK